MKIELALKKSWRELNEICPESLKIELIEIDFRLNNENKFDTYMTVFFHDKKTASNFTVNTYGQINFHDTLEKAKIEIKTKFLKPKSIRI